MKVKIGQIWYYTAEPQKLYRISNIELRLDGYYRVNADLLDENENFLRVIGFGALNPDRSPRWSSTIWQIKYPLNSFSRISPKTLRKRVRDQMAGAILAHRLTEETPKLLELDDFLGYRGLARAQTQTVEQTIADIRYFQQGLMESLNIPSNFFNNR